jgi:hypothetical protein
MDDRQLSSHFSLSEVVFSSTAARLSLDNTPTEEIIAAATIAASGMERVRSLLGNIPIHVDSWYRCPALNKAVGGALDSAHMAGYAVDFLCRPHTVDEIIQAIAVSDIDFDQMIQEGTWVHCSFDPRLRREVLLAHFGPGGTTYSTY